MQTEGRQKVGELVEEGCFRRRWPSIVVHDDDDLVPNPNVEQLPFERRGGNAEFCNGCG